MQLPDQKQPVEHELMPIFLEVILLKLRMKMGQRAGFPRPAGLR